MVEHPQEPGMADRKACGPHVRDGSRARRMQAPTKIKSIEKKSLTKKNPGTKIQSGKTNA